MSKPSLSDEEILNMICTALQNIHEALWRKDYVSAEGHLERLYHRIAKLAGNTSISDQVFKTIQRSRHGDDM